MRVWTCTLSGRLPRKSSLFLENMAKRIINRFIMRIMRIIELGHLETTWILQEQVHHHV
jgi:hypothetical protein